MALAVSQAIQVLHPVPSSRAPAAFTGTNSRLRPSVRCSAATQPSAPTTKRELLVGTATAAVATALVALRPPPSSAAAAPPPEVPASALLCDSGCQAELDAKELVTTGSGLQYKDIVLGSGPTPITGFQVVCNYVAMVPSGRVFESSLEKGKPYDIRFGSGQVIPGLDEGLSTMRVGGIRRLYIPGDLAFPKGLKAAAGRPTVPAKTPVVFDVQLLYIPGLEDDE